MSNLKVDLSLNDNGLKQQIQQDKKAVQDFSKEVQDGGKSVQSMASKLTAAIGGVSNYRRQLADLTKQVISLEMSWANLSDEQRKSDIGQELARQLTEAKEKAAQFKDQIIDTQNEIQQLSSDSFKSDALAGGIDLVSTSMSAMVAVTQLAGGQTENLQKAISKLILIQTASAAGIKIINALQAQSALMLGVRKAQEAAATAAIAIRTAAEGKSVIATKSATAAQMAFNAVSKANPYILLATAIVGVAGALWAFTGRSDEATEAEKRRQKEIEATKRKTEMMESVQQTYTQTLANSYSQLMSKYTQLQSEWKSLTSNMQRVEWIRTHQSAFNDLGLSVSSVQDAERIFNGNTEGVVDSFKKRAIAAALAAKMTALYQKQIELEESYFSAYRAKAVRPGDRANWHPTATEQATWNGTHGVSKSGNYESTDGGVTWRYTAKGAKEANAELAKTDESLKTIRSDYEDINGEITNTSNRMAGLAQSVKQVQTTPAKTTHTPGKTTEEKPSYAKDSLTDLENQLSELQKKYKDGLITLNKDEYLAEVERLQKAIEGKKIELGLFVPEDKVSKQLADLQKKDANISRSQTFSSFDVAIGNNRPNGARDLSYLQAEMNFNDSLLQQLQELANAYKELGDAGAEGLKKITEEIGKVTDKQKQLGITAKQYTEQNKKVEESAQKWQSVGDMVSSAGSAFSSLGSSFEIPALNVAGIIANAIASVIQGYATASAQSATLGPWAWAAFSLAGLAQVASVISQIHSLSGYAEGGIVGGGSYFGDGMLARVNSGEMILNDTQQYRLFKMLNEGGAGHQTTLVSGDVRIKGSDLYLALHNYGKTQKSVGRNIGI